MLTVLLVVHLMIAVALVGTVLLQRSEGGALGIGGGGGGGFMTGRGTANALTRLTAALALGFFLTSILLTLLARIDRPARSIIDTLDKPAQTAPLGGTAPVTTPGNSGAATPPATPGTATPAPATTPPATTGAAPATTPTPATGSTPAQTPAPAKTP